MADERPPACRPYPQHNWYEITRPARWFGVRPARIEWLCARCRAFTRILPKEMVSLKLTGMTTSIIEEVAPHRRRRRFILNSWGYARGGRIKR